MGCDIHLHVEIKVRGEWLHYNQPRIKRDYALFTKMAGVRNYDDEIDPISEPRGIPLDCTKTTQLVCDHWDTDGHSHSWLSYEEISQLQEWHEKRTDSYFKFYDNFGYMFGNGWRSKHRCDDPEFLEDVRFIFWFDN